MSILFHNGYDIDTIRLFYGNEHDSKIVKKIIYTVNQLTEWLSEDDNFIVDRGFRDILKMLKHSG